MEDVLVLMSTYNGEKYLCEQIESLINQTGVNVSILVRDDGSTDGTLKILQNYKEKGILDYYTGENLKPARSFMDLVYNAPESPYYAFCDQDDVWLPGKLFAATEALKNLEGPAMYYHAMDLVDESLNKYGYYFRDPIKTQSLQYSCLFGDEIAGCTMVYNQKLQNKLCLYEPAFVTMHDGWVHRVCLCVGGTVLGDKESYILYRQHGNNAVGMQKRSISNKMDKFSRREKRFSKLAGEMLSGYMKQMQDDDIRFLELVGCYSSLNDKINIIKVARNLEASTRLTLTLAMKLFANGF